MAAETMERRWRSTRPGAMFVYWEGFLMKDITTMLEAKAARDLAWSLYRSGNAELTQVKLEEGHYVYWITKRRTRASCGGECN